MSRHKEEVEKKELKQFCILIHKYIQSGEYERAKQEICDAFKQYPHAPEPHNCMGLLLEKERDHLLAMKHFRAAYALDAGYIPARFNIEIFGAHPFIGEGIYNLEEKKEREKALEEGTKEGEYGMYQ